MRTARNNFAGRRVLRVRDGKVARITNYYNLQDWIAQVSQ